MFISLELVYSQDNDKICKACISRYRITSTWNWKSTVLLASHENQEKATRIPILILRRVTIEPNVCDELFKSCLGDL